MCGRTVDLQASAVLVRRMNIATTKGTAQEFAVPPEYPDLRPDRRHPGGGRLHLCAVDHGRPAVAALGGARRVHRGRRHRLSRWLLCANLEPAFGVRPDARSDRRQAAGRLLPADAGRRRHHPRLVAVGRHRDPVPRDPGVGLARISRRAARQRARHQARQMEDHGPAGRDRLPAGRRGRRPDVAVSRCPVVTQIGLVLLWISAIFTIYTGWDYFRAGIHHLIKEDEG